MPATETGEAQEPRRDAAIAGTIVDRQTGAPVANARLTLASCSFPSPDTSYGWPFAEAGVCVAGRTRTQLQSGPDGTFAFTAGRGHYVLAVEAAGFVSQEYGQRTLPGNGRPITVSDGGGPRALRVAMIRTARVAGRVLTRSQQPLPNVPIEILRRTYRHNGERVLEIVGRAVTNARGEYWLSSLDPGEYHIAAGRAPSGGGRATAEESEGSALGYVYFPGVADLRAARTVTVAAGEDRTGVEFTVGDERYRLAGRVLRADGMPVNGTGAVDVVFMRPEVQHRSALHPAGSTIADGRFQVADLAPGDYLIRATMAGGLTSAPFNVTIVDEDLAGIDLRLPDSVERDSAIDGRWSVDGVRTRPSRHALSPCEEGIRVFPYRVSFRWPVFTGEGPEAESPWLQEDGTFSFQYPAPGQYRLHLLCPAADVYVKEARLDGADVLGRRFTLDPSTRHVLDVVFSRRAGSVDVNVTSASETVAGSRVVLAPFDRERVDLFQSGLADANGRIRFVNVPPGTYDLFAWYALEPYGYFDPGVLKRAIGSARSVTVSESSPAAVIVPLIPAAGAEP